jgi:hypothetical protein
MQKRQVGVFDLAKGQPVLLCDLVSGRMTELALYSQVYFTKGDGRQKG